MKKAMYKAGGHAMSAPPVMPPCVKYGTKGVDTPRSPASNYGVGGVDAGEGGKMSYGKKGKMSY
jgi:hypothetical protein